MDSSALIKDVEIILKIGHLNDIEKAKQIQSLLNPSTELPEELIAFLLSKEHYQIFGYLISEKFKEKQQQIPISQFSVSFSNETSVIPTDVQNFFLHNRIFQIREQCNPIRFV